jgi:hypothetical protein
MCNPVHRGFVKLALDFSLAGWFWFLIVSLQERIKGPTAARCADGKMSGPSA